VYEKNGPMLKESFRGGKKTRGDKKKKNRTFPERGGISRKEKGGRSMPLEDKEIL